jgi:hypothetical protein
MNLSFLSHVDTISGIEEVSVFGYLNEDKKPCVKVLDRDEQEPFFEVTPKMIKLLTVEYTFRALTKLSKHRNQEVNEND